MNRSAAILTASACALAGLLAPSAPSAAQQPAQPPPVPPPPQPFVWADRGLAVGDVPVPPPPDPQIRFSVNAGYQHIFQTGLSTTGNVAIDRVGLEIGAQFDLTRDLSIIANFGFEGNRYQFSQVTDLGADPWDDVYWFGLDVRLQWAMTDQALLWVGGYFHSWGENGATFGNTITGGGFMGASWVWDENLTVGVGFGVGSQISKDVIGWPIFQLHWQITPNLSFDTVPGPTGLWASGLEVAWAFNEMIDLGLGARYDYRRFRLNNVGVAPGGAGQEIVWPMWLRLGFQFSHTFSLDLYGGIATGGELALDDSNGLQLASTRYNVAPMVAVTGSLRF